MYITYLYTRRHTHTHTVDLSGAGLYRVKTNVYHYAKMNIGFDCIVFIRRMVVILTYSIHT